MVRLPPSDTLVESRIGDARRVSTQYVLDELLPPLHPRLDVDKVLVTIKRSGKKGRRPITKGGRWRGLAKDLDADHTQKMLARSKFSSFKDILLATAKAGTLHGAGSPLELAHNRVQGAEFSYEEREALPDTFLVTRELSMDDRMVVTEDVSVAGDYTPLADVRAQEEVCPRCR